MNLQELSNKELYALCKQYGKNVRKWSREFGFLLPEVAKRGMYRKYHCTSIYEFAAKLAGMSHDVTARILNLAQKLADKPIIWNEFKKYGWTKLMVIADTVTTDTQEFWLDKLRKLPRPALQEYLKVWKKNNKIRDSFEDKPLINNLFTFVAQENHETQVNGLPEPEIKGSTGLCYETPSVNKKIFKKLRMMVDSETEFEFRKFKQAMEKEKKTALTMGETLKFLLEKVKKLENIQAEKNTNAVARPFNSLGTDTANNDALQIHSDKPKHILEIKQATRHVSKKIETPIISYYNGKCAFPDCNEPYAELHHPDRFSLKKSHQSIYPLCKTHHQAAHSGLIKNEDQPVEKWQFDLSASQKITDNQKVMAPATSLTTLRQSTSRLENTFNLYQASQKDYVDSKVRNHWVT